MAARALGIDFGETRIGLAISDDDGRVATPLETLRRSSDAGVIEAIRNIVEREGIGRLVLGDPLRLDGTAGDAARRVRSFGRKLTEATGLECTLVAETLTSVAAEEVLRDAGIDPRRHPERIDAVAAQIILQGALDEEQR